MNEVYFELQGRIHLSSGISLDDTLSSLACMLCSNVRLAELAVIFGPEVLECPELTLFRFNGDYYLLYQMDLVGRISDQMLTLDKVIGMSPRMICFELDNERQMLIEKAYFNSAGKNYKFSEKKGTLVFVKEAYRGRASTQAVNYFGSIDEMIKNISSPQQWSISVPIKDLLAMYDSCSELPNLDISKLMVTYERVQMLRSMKQNVRKAQEMIFTDQRPRKQVELDINRLKLPRDIYEKLIWKSKQMQKYRNLRKESRQINSNDYSKLNLIELKPQIIYLWIGKYQYQWMRNSLQALKDKFWAIANQRDLKGRQSFQTEYDSLVNKLQQVENTYGKYEQGQAKPKSQTISRMRQQLNWFKKYHDLVIKEESLSSIQYIRQEARYLWKYDNRLYKKVALFFFIMLLAYFQKNYILGLTIFSVGVISLAIRI